MKNDELFVYKKSSHCNWNTFLMYITTKATATAEKHKVKLMNHIYYFMRIKFFTPEFSELLIYEYLKN